MRSLAVLLFLVAGCSKTKEPTPVSGSAVSALPPMIDAEATAGSDMGSGSAGSGSDASGSAAAGSGSDAAGSGAGSAGTKFVFDDLEHQAKVDFMKKVVMPKMKPIFQAFDKKRYASFTCKTCHGKDPQKSKYKMPTPDLPKLDFAALKAGKQKPTVAKWMGEVVNPTMAKLLELPEMSETNHEGFGCLDCHEQKK